MGQTEGGRSDQHFPEAADHPGRRTSTWKTGKVHEGAVNFQCKGNDCKRPLSRAREQMPVRLYVSERGFSQNTEGTV